MLRAFYFSLLVMLVGCASSGFNREDMKGDLFTQQKEFSDVVVQENFKRRGNLQKVPVNVAVALVPSYQDRWVGDEKDQLVEAGDILKKEGVVNNFAIIPNMLLKDRSLPTIRRAAAQLGADVVLVLGSSVKVDPYANWAAITYITLVGMLVVPGSHRDALCVLEGVLFDVGNEFIYLGVESEGKGSTLGPLAFVEKRDAIVEAKKEAVKNFIPEFLKQMRSLKAAKEKAEATQ